MSFLPSVPAGTEGKKLTSTQIKERLIQEAQNNVGITFSENEGNDSFVVSGRGELMLEILLTQMRREGFEMTVSPPKVLYKKDENGNKLEPIEEITMDLDEEHSSIDECSSSRSIVISSIGSSLFPFSSFLYKTFGGLTVISKPSLLI